MKSTVFTLFVNLTLLFVSFTYGQNAGKSYKDIKNHNPAITQRYSADPGVMVYDGRVYVYATNDGDTSQRFTNENKYDQINTINCMSSADLVNWMDHGPIPAAGPNGAAKWAKNSWAPTAAHKKIDGKERFFLYFADSGNGIGVLTADNPAGPFKDPLGHALINRQTPNCANVTWLFDPAVFVDDDGTGYIYFGGGVPSGQSANPKTARVAKLGNDMTSIVGQPNTIDAPWLFEDSGINKIGNTYIYSYCTNWDNGPYGNAKIAYMTSNSPMGPFQYQGTCFNNPGDFFQTAGNNHHTIIEFKGKHYIFYHAEWLNKQILGSPKGYRTTHVDEMPVSGGKFGNARGTLEGVAQLADVDGSALNYAAMMAWQSGINVKGNGAVTTVEYGPGAWTGVSKVALGGAKSITLKASSRSGATINIVTDSPSGQAIGSVKIPAGGSLQQVTGTLNGATGSKNLFFVASGDAVIESWQLTGGSGGGAAAPASEPASQEPASEPAAAPEPASPEPAGGDAPAAPGGFGGFGGAPGGGDFGGFGGFGGAPGGGFGGFGGAPGGGFGGFGGAPGGGFGDFGGFGGAPGGGFGGAPGGAAMGNAVEDTPAPAAPAAPADSGNAGGATGGADPNFHIYLAFGQSNMEGAGPIGNEDRTVDKRFQMLSAYGGCNNREVGQWYDATPPLANCNGKLGPVDYFGRTLVKNLPENVKVGVVVVAVAGCDIQLFEKDKYQSYNMESWMKNIVNQYGGNPYGRLVEMAKKAQQKGVIKGILLHQGETNSGQQNWPQRVKGVYQNLLSDLGLKAENVPLLVGEVVSSASGGSCGGMNSIIDTVPNVIPTAHVISSQGLNQQGDGLHFTSEAYRTFGQRYAEEMLKHLDKSSTAAPAAPAAPATGNDEGDAVPSPNDSSDVPSSDNTPDAGGFGGSPSAAPGGDFGGFGGGDFGGFGGGDFGGFGGGDFGGFGGGDFGGFGGAPGGGFGDFGGFGGFGGAPGGGFGDFGGFGGFGGAPPAGGFGDFGGFGGFGGAPPAGGFGDFGGFGGFGGAPPAGGFGDFGGFGGFGGAPPAGGFGDFGGFGGFGGAPAFKKRSACAGLNGQCGGLKYNGPTCCESGECKKINEWISVCQ